MVFDPLIDAIVLQHCEYELDVPLANLGVCVEGRHITDLYCKYRLWTKVTFVQTGSD
jgi:hypothetical protein